MQQQERSGFGRERQEKRTFITFIRAQRRAEREPEAAERSDLHIVGNCSLYTDSVC
jgi:hypothetical protein